MDFDSPFLIVYIGTSLFSIFLPMRLCYERRSWWIKCVGKLGCSSSTGGQDSEAMIIPWKNNDHNVPILLAPSARDGGGFEQVEGSLDDTATLMPTQKSVAYQKSGNEHDGGGAGTLGVEMNELSYEDDSKRKISDNHHYEPTPSPHDRSAIQSNNINNYLLSHQDHIRMASYVAPIWFLSNYFYAQSLEWTTIASSTVLASMGSLFAFGFATCSRFGDERITKGKLLGVLLCFLGGVATAWTDIGGSGCDSDSDSGDDYNNGENGVHLRYLRYLRHSAMPRRLSDLDDPSLRSLMGDLAGLLSAVGYGAYTVLLRHLCPKDEDRFSMQLLFGYIGLWNMVLLFPAAIWVVVDNNDHGSSYNEGGNTISDENYSSEWMLPTNDYPNNDNTAAGDSYNSNDSTTHSTLTWSIFLFLLLKGLLDNVLSDYLWARAVILTSATVASVGVGLTIPMAFAADWVMGNYTDTDGAGTGEILGAIFVLLGFLFVNVNVFGEKEGTRNDVDDEEVNFEDHNGIGAESVGDTDILL